MRPDKPSATAYLIARSTYFLSNDSALGHLVPERSAELSLRFIQARRHFGKTEHFARSKYFRPLVSLLERATIPGIKLHYALRKRYLEEIARAALHSGIRQVVIIGAGFDTLALRLHESFSETEFFEIDHPATQREKRLVAEQHQPLARNLHFVAFDLAHGNIEECLLADTRYLSDADTLFIAEGLLMYLTPAEVDLLLQFVRRSGLKSRIAFTFMEMQKGERIGFRRSSCLVDVWLRLRNESFKWGISREQIAGFLQARGFKLCEAITAEDLRNLYLSSTRPQNLPLAEGECICVAELD